MKKTKFLATISSIAIVISTSACLDSETRVSQADAQQDFIKSTARQYAQSLEQYSLQSVQLITASPSWVNGAYAADGGGSLINFEDLGGTVGATEDIAESGFCVVDPADPRDAIHITWFESQNDDHFALNGLGVNSAALLVSEMANRVGENALGTYRGDNVIQITGTNENLVLPAGCEDLGVDINSPVIISYLDMPQLPDDAVTRTEYTTIACEDGKVGHYLLSLDVSYLSDGRRAVAGQILEEDDPLPVTSSNPDETVWTVQEANCKDDIVLTTMSTNEAISQGVNLSMAATGAVGNNINTNLNNINCNEAQVVANESDHDNHNDHEHGNNHDDDYEHGDDHDDDHGDDYGDDVIYETSDSYTTCGETTDVADIANAGDVRLTWLRTEVHTTDCGGAPGFYTDSADGFSGEVTHDIWLGNAVYNREVYLQEATNIINASTDREERESWYGSSIECQRQEDLHILCNTGYPALASFPLDDDTGYHYRRNNSISGWADSVNIMPNAPADPNWNFRAAASNCQWREGDTWGCSEGSEGQTQEGQRDRTHVASALNITPTISAWTTIQPALCEDRKTEPGSCPSGQSGSATDHLTRIYTSPEPGVGSWGDWAVTSTDTSGCHDDSGGDDGGGPSYTDYDGDGDGDCSGACDPSDHPDVDNYNGDDGDDSGSSGGDSVLCTYFHVEKGWLDTRTYRGSNLYGARHIDRPTLNGYHYWAVPLIEFMRKSDSKLLEKIVYKVLVEGWTREMAYRSGIHKTGSLRGKIILSTIKPVCSFIGKYVGRSDIKKLWTGFRV